MATEEKAFVGGPEPPAVALRFDVPENYEFPAKTYTVGDDFAPPAQNDYQNKVLETIITARQIATPGKGLLAADESTGTIGKRFAGMGKDENGNPIFTPDQRPGGEGTPKLHQLYREMLFTTPEMENYISGVIMFEETLYEGRLTAPYQLPNGETVAAGAAFSELLDKRGIITGIKVDAGAKQDLPQVPNAPYTKGLDSLPFKCAKAYACGARFAKWRATLKIVDGYISQAAIQETAWTLARYASICQVNGLAPIVEPEILMDGPHSLAVGQYWTEKVLNACYKALIDQEVILEGTLLKPNMCLPGQDNPQHLRRETPDDASCLQDTPEEMNRDQQFALATVTALKRTVPAAVPGIVFLSGGQTELQATARLQYINSLGPLPWNASFSYGRALQASCLRVWKGDMANKEAAQQQYLKRASANGAAQLGQFARDGDSYTQYDTVAQRFSSYVPNYKY